MRWASRRRAHDSRRRLCMFFSPMFFVLMRDVVPKMGGKYAWPVAQDHCFVRIYLDISLGRPWLTCLKPPEIRNMTDEQLNAAIRFAKDLCVRRARSVR